jgi:peptidoglycan-associated lipoprotein
LRSHPREGSTLLQALSFSGLRSRQELPGQLSFSWGGINMTQQRLKFLSLAMVLGVMASLAGCSKKAARVTPPTSPPSAPAPTASVSVNPNIIHQGQSTTLSWQTTNSTDATIAGLGAVPESGSRTLTPSESTTYTLEAKGPGGTKDASARVTVNATTARMTAPSPTDEDLFARNMKDVYFDYDRFNIRSDQMPSAQLDASFLQQHSSIKVLVEGHCDDRGSEEYNLALGTSRAEAVKRSLLQQGVAADRINTISYGKEKPFCTQENEPCWQQNRVDHLTFER